MVGACKSADSRAEVSPWRRPMSKAHAIWLNTMEKMGLERDSREK